VTCRKHSPGNPCCVTECGCDAILEEDLPTVTITGMTGDGWESTAPCCWRQRFTYDDEQTITFVQKLLQDDSWDIYEENEIDQYYTDKFRESVVGQWLHTDSGGTTVEDCGHPGDTPIVPTRPPCREILDPTTPCLDYNRTSSQAWQQRWGFRSRPKYIDVSIQYTKATCGEDPEACVYMIASQFISECESSFVEFEKHRVISNYSASGCCTAPPNTNVGTNYPSFVEGEFFPGAFAPTFFLTTISSVVVSTLGPQTINFGYNICSDCDITNGLTCYGECRNDCATASGTGTVHSGPYGLALCTSHYAYTDNCSYDYHFPCQDTHKHPYCDTDPVEYYCEQWVDDYADWPTFTAAWTQKSLTGAMGCSFTTPEGTYFGTPNWFLGEAINGNRTYIDNCLAPCLLIYDESGVECTEDILTPWFVANRGQNIVLTYSYSCSGALNESVCLNPTWSVVFS
jgi:hypothetical protein